ncbi:MAG: carbon starvation protein A [candidate division Zixibacteria bacterium]|nr:carbon starvation protein A [candidate division Zixibacteria bacterium]
MNTVIVAIVGLAWLYFAYRWYARRIDQRIIQPDDTRPTPGTEVNDNRDYVPTRPLVLFGHHFSSIAGAGPIVGPILALALFGWLPALIWILVGSVFVGAVHDYTALMVSIRHRGVSIVEIAGTAISNTARWVLSAFVWFALVLVQAVFAVLCAQTLTEKPEIVIPTLGIVALAILFGAGVYKRILNFSVGTVLALGAMVALIFIGQRVPIEASYNFWLVVFIGYAFIAAILPVWVLLQPRDYLSVYILLAGMVLGFGGLFVFHPSFNAPALHAVSSTQGPIWPMLFIVVACGAASGFHCLVSSGTTAKQLNRESDGRKIAFGGMLTEGALAMLVVLIIGGALYWKEAPTAAVSGYVFQDLLGQSANIAFGTALGRVMGSLGIPIAIGTAFGVLMLNAFILTTLDTTVRLSRYIVQETAGQKVAFFRNPYVAAGLGLALAFYFCIGGNWKIIWPLFGASNQLVAALALMVVTAYFIAVKKPTLYTFIPAVFMVITTEAALIYQLFWIFLPDGKWVLSVVAIFLMLLGLMVTYEVFRKFRVAFGNGRRVARDVAPQA